MIASKDRLQIIQTHNRRLILLLKLTLKTKQINSKKLSPIFFFTFFFTSFLLCKQHTTVLISFCLTFGF